MDDIALILVAGGTGSRADMGDGLPKQYRLLAGKPLLAHTLAALLAHHAIARIQPVIGDAHRERFEDVLMHIGVGRDRILSPVTGGATRQASVRNGLVALSGHPPAFVLIHDAARPFVSTDLIDRVVAALDTADGAIPALGLTDTIKRVGDDGAIAETLDRTRLYAAQTPQGFRFSPILAAHSALADAHTGLTDDAHVAETAGLRVVLVEGDAGNIKITTKEDVMAAEQKLSGGQRYETRVGTGYDVHAFEPGDAVILGGVRIPHVAKLNGHSDADAALHALTDALYGALGAGDIGTHFPPSDPQWKGAASRLFIEHAAKMVRDRGGRIVNLDVTLICEAPKIAPHVAAMREAIAGFCGIAVERVAVKATTSEKLGFTGRREGIAAIGTASVELPVVVA